METEPLEIQWRTGLHTHTRPNGVTYQHGHRTYPGKFHGHDGLPEIPGMRPIPATRSPPSRRHTYAFLISPTPASFTGTTGCRRYPA